MQVQGVGCLLMIDITGDLHMMNWSSGVLEYWSLGLGDWYLGGLD